MAINHLLSTPLYDELFQHNVISCDGRIIANEQERMKYKAFLTEKYRNKTAQIFKDRKSLVDKVQALLKTPSRSIKSNEEMKICLEKLGLHITADGMVSRRQAAKPPKQYLGPSYPSHSLTERQIGSRAMGRKVQRRDLKLLDGWLTRISDSGTRMQKMASRTHSEWKKDELKYRAKMESVLTEMAKCRRNLVRKCHENVQYKWISVMERLLENMAHSKKIFETVGTQGITAQVKQPESEEDSIVCTEDIKDEEETLSECYIPPIHNNQIESLKNDSMVDNMTEIKNFEGRPVEEERVEEERAEERSVEFSFEAESYKEDGIEAEVLTTGSIPRENTSEENDITVDESTPLSKESDDDISTNDCLPVDVEEDVIFNKDGEISTTSGPRSKLTLDIEGKRAFYRKESPSDNESASGYEESAKEKKILVEQLTSISTSKESKQEDIQSLENENESAAVIGTQDGTKEIFEDSLIESTSKENISHHDQVPKGQGLNESATIISTREETKGIEDSAIESSSKENILEQGQEPNESATIIGTQEETNEIVEDSVIEPTSKENSLEQGKGAKYQGPNESGKVIGTQDVTKGIVEDSEIYSTSKENILEQSQEPKESATVIGTQDKIKEIVEDSMIESTSKENSLEQGQGANYQGPNESATVIGTQDETKEIVEDSVIESTSKENKLEQGQEQEDKSSSGIAEFLESSNSQSARISEIDEMSSRNDEPVQRSSSSRDTTNILSGTIQYEEENQSNSSEK